MQDFEILTPLHLTLICDRTNAFFQSLQKPRGTSKQSTLLFSQAKDRHIFNF